MRQGQVLTRVYRRITISIENIDDHPQYSIDQEFLTIDVGAEMTVDDLKGYIENETGVKKADQRIYYNDQELVDGLRTLQQCQIVEDSMLGMQIRRVIRGRNVGSNRPPQSRVTDPEMYRLRVLGNPAELAQLQQRNPELANAVHDPVRFRETFEQLLRRQTELESERQRREDLLAADPFNIDAQREIEEMIREEQVMENLQNAVEHNPEGGSFLMLYAGRTMNAN